MNITETAPGVWTFESEVLENGLQLEGHAKKGDTALIEVRATLSGKTLVKGRKHKTEIFEVYNYTVWNPDEFLPGALTKIAKQGNYAQRMSKILHQTKKQLSK